MVWALVLVAAIIPALALGTPVTAEDKLAQDTDVIEFVSGICTMHGSQGKIPEVIDTIDKVQTCTESLTKSADKVKYSEAFRNADFDEMFKRYCTLAPELKNCTYSLLNFIALCGNDDGEIVDKKEVEETRYFFDQLIDYACQKDGERIASFMKEGGIQCLQKNSKALRKCGSFISDQIASDDDEDNSEENDSCEVFEHTANCFLSSMEGCDAKPVKIAKELSVHLRKVANCTGSEEAGVKVYKQWLQKSPKIN